MAIQKEGRNENTYWVLSVITKGIINPTITKADTFASATPSTLFPAYAKIIIAATTLSIVANIDIINVVHNDISDTEQKESSTKETMAANKTEISNLDIRYPFLPSGVIVIYLLIFMSVSSNTTKIEAKQIM
ncbi:MULTISPECIES: hypothetical protein [Bacteroides]|uniref:Transmembrane protein n=1 Tax=Bacteroides fragilis TaxID=817 RepID=A0A9Q4JGW3_BACFG|nr:hypothetical protein [Bacteroides fragilis]MCZ2614156.1 hypothetical protein [Bacteroides fragilis]MCZ2687614.1 hypothetical protein [Bacteroides fragilis]